MKNKLNKIFEKHSFEPITLPSGYSNVYAYLRDNPNEINRFSSKKNCEYLNKKYQNNIPNGWYGFDIGIPIIPEWMDIIDETLEMLIEADNDMEIYQVKLKYGGIRLYINSDVIPEIFEIEAIIENELFDEKLIY